MAPIAEGDAVEPAKIGRQGCAPGLSRADGISGSHRDPTYDEPRKSLFDSGEPVMHQIIDAVAPGDALDAACGTGRYAEYLAGRGHRLVGVDSSPDMLARARARAPSGEFVLGDLRRLPLPDSSVDLIVSGLALCHVPTLAPVMAEFARVLRSGGHLAISDVHHEITIRGSVHRRSGRVTNPDWSPATGIPPATSCAPRSQPGCRSDAARNPADQTTTCHRHHRPPPT